MSNETMDVHIKLLIFTTSTELLLDHIGFCFNCQINYYHVSMIASNIGL